MNKKIILASASPRRRELLSVIADDFSVFPSSAEEIVPKGTKNKQVAEILAMLKAKDVAQFHKDAIIIGADTCVIVEDEILGKPENKADAYRMMKMLSGKTHSVITGCYIICDNRTVSFSVETRVEFYDLTEDEIENYINSSEPYDKAGAYGIQGKASLFVKGIEGDYFNVVGLPISRLYNELKKYINCGGCKNGN